jgi:hypothetical protein
MSGAQGGFPVDGAHTDAGASSHITPRSPRVIRLAHASIRECTLSRCGLSPSGQAAYRSGAE